MNKQQLLEKRNAEVDTRRDGGVYEQYQRLAYGNDAIHGGFYQ